MGRTMGTGGAEKRWEVATICARNVIRGQTAGVGYYLPNCTKYRFLYPLTASSPVLYQMLNVRNAPYTMRHALCALPHAPSPLPHAPYPCLFLKKTLSNCNTEQLRGIHCTKTFDIVPRVSDRRPCFTEIFI